MYFANVSLIYSNSGIGESGAGGAEGAEGAALKDTASHKGAEGRGGQLGTRN